MTTRLDLETSALLLLTKSVQRQLALPRNRRKGVPTQDVATLLRMAQDEIDEALHALRSGRGDAAVLEEIGDAAA
ncbi:MAG: hypothetical protein EBY80_13735, partial [Actinobacteria bacterium]|nr:hypothetical protein [Actinomycetota bacterium]